MRLSLLSGDNGVAELLINKSMELMSQAETAAEGERGSDTTGESDRGRSPGVSDNSHH
jgi:hypothetical protein